MFNSYSLAFGEPEGESSDVVSELVCELAGAFEYEKYHEESVRNKNLKAFTEVLGDFLPSMELNDKAHILDGCFHFANENFYELEDDGIVDSSADCQDNFLSLVEEALKSI